MGKLVLDNVVSLQSEPSALQTMASNNERVEAALENTLSRDGTGPNQMEAPLDLNGHHILNVGPPVSGSDVARLQDVRNALSADLTLIPPLIANYIMSNDGTGLVWRNALSIPGLGDLKSVNNLSELTDVTAARANMGLGSAATQSIGTSGSSVPLLSGSNTFSGSNTYSGMSTFSGKTVLSGSANHELTAAPTSLSENSLGRRVPRSKVRDSNYIMVLDDASDSLIHTSATPHAWTIPPESASAFPGSTQLLLINTGAGAVTIVRGAGVSLRIAGTAVDKNVTLAQHSVATLIRASSNMWYIVGPGVT